MFNKGFYPSPEPVIELLMQGVKLTESMTILEPSAGKGDILDWIVKKLQVKRYGYNTDLHREHALRNLFAIEIAAKEYGVEPGAISAEIERQKKGKGEGFKCQKQCK